MRIVLAGLAILAGSLLQTTDTPRLVGGDIAKPKRVKFVEPVYPPEAQSRGIQSVVIVELTVNPQGSVVSARPLRGDATVIPAAVAAARQWSYEPTLVAGNPVSVQFAETVLFILRKPVVPEAGTLGGNGMFLRPPTPGATASSYGDWQVQGEAMTCCPCDTPCPCRLNSAPSHPPCHAATAQHFFRGHYGSVDLSGVTFITLGPENWTAIYFDEAVSTEQRQAVVDIYSSMVPGAPQVFRSLQSVSILYEVSEDGRTRRVEIPNVLEMASRAPLDEQGQLQGLSRGMDVWSNTLAYGENLVYRYTDATLQESWDHSGRQCNHKTFQTTKQMYDDGLMLIQHGDGSGDWTERQRPLACPRR